MMWHPSPKMPEAWARVEWCRKNFGASGGVDGRYRPSDGHRRWYRSGGRLYFRNEKDLLLYLLRWA
jgi:hypothetical protein